MALFSQLWPVRLHCEGLSVLLGQLPSVSSRSFQPSQGLWYTVESQTALRDGQPEGKAVCVGAPTRVLNTLLIDMETACKGLEQA